MTLRMRVAEVIRGYGAHYGIGEHTALDMADRVLSAIAMEARQRQDPQGLDPKGDSAGRQASPNPTRGDTHGE